MKNFNIYEKADCIVSEFLRIFETLVFKKNYSSLRKYLSPNSFFKGIHTNDVVHILCNGPSINTLKLSEIRSSIVISMNRSFNFLQRTGIKPKYHIVIDEKLYNGDWSIDILQRVYDINPDVIFLLNAKWALSDSFLKLVDKYNVMWIYSRPISICFPQQNTIDLTTIFDSYMVAEQALAFSLYCEFKDIFIHGYEGTGIAKLLLQRPTHFDGLDPDKRNLDTLNLSRCLYFSSKHLRYFEFIRDFYSSFSSNIYNVTPDSLFTGFRSTNNIFYD